MFYFVVWFFVCVRGRRINGFVLGKVSLRFIGYFNVNIELLVNYISFEFLGGVRS